MTIITPIGKREVSKEVYQLFENFPTSERTQISDSSYSYEWEERNGKLVSRVKPKSA